VDRFTGLVFEAIDGEEVDRGGPPELAVPQLEPEELDGVGLWAGLDEAFPHPAPPEELVVVEVGVVGVERCDGLGLEPELADPQPDIFVSRNLCTRVHVRCKLL
jgi:hypothetical protein